MKTVSCCILIVILCISMLSVRTAHLQVGSNLNAQLIYMETFKLSAVPLTRRTKNVFFNENGTNNTRAIKGITALDLTDSKAKAIITAGGLTLPYVNIRLQSERGVELNYQIQIYA